MTIVHLRAFEIRIFGPCRLLHAFIHCPNPFSSDGWKPAMCSLSRRESIRYAEDVVFHHVSRSNFPIRFLEALISPMRLLVKLLDLPLSLKPLTVPIFAYALRICHFTFVILTSSPAFSSYSYHSPSVRSIPENFVPDSAPTAFHSPCHQLAH